MTNQKSQSIRHIGPASTAAVLFPTRHIFSAEKLGETDEEPDTPHRNFIPENGHSCVAQDDSSHDSARPTGDPLGALSNLASLLKSDASSKPADPALMLPKPG